VYLEWFVSWNADCATTHFSGECKCTHGCSTCSLFCYIICSLDL